MKNMKRAALAVIWLIALCACLLFADRAMRRDDGKRKYGNFFAETQDFDVFFMGTSRVLDGVQPMELWRDYGFTSYNMGNNSENLEMTKWVLDIAMDTHKPKAALIDVYYVDRKVTDAWAFSFRHLFLDEIPLSRKKIECVQATLPKSEWTEFLMPFSLYHGRWEEILSGSTEEQVICRPFAMGAELRAQRETPTISFVRTKEMNTQEMEGKESLRKIAALCRENGVEPVFMAIPAPISEVEQMNVNSVQLIADELGVPFINMLDVEGLVDFDNDCYDALGHLNPDGASKVTAYLGQWLSEHFDFEDKRGDAAYAHWNENLEAYEAYRETVWGDMTLLD